MSIVYFCFNPSNSRQITNKFLEVQKIRQIFRQFRQFVLKKSVKSPKKLYIQFPSKTILKCKSLGMTKNPSKFPSKIAKKKQKYEYPRQKIRQVSFSHNSLQNVLR